MVFAARLTVLANAFTRNYITTSFSLVSKFRFQYLVHLSKLISEINPPEIIRKTIGFLMILGGLNSLNLFMHVVKWPNIL